MLPKLDVTTLFDQTSQEAIHRVWHDLSIGASYVSASDFVIL